jgi:hypothetical protein
VCVIFQVLSLFSFRRFYFIARRRRLDPHAPSRDFSSFLEKKKKKMENNKKKIHQLYGKDPTKKREKKRKECCRRL